MKKYLKYIVKDFLHLIQDEEDLTTQSNIVGGRYNSQQIITDFITRLRSTQSDPSPNLPRICSIRSHEIDYQTLDADNIDTVNQALDPDTRRRLINTILENGSFDIVSDTEMNLDVSRQSINHINLSQINENILSILVANLRNTSLHSYIFNVINNPEVSMNREIPPIVNTFLYAIQNPNFQRRLSDLSLLSPFNITDLFLEDLRSVFQALILVLHQDNISQIADRNIRDIRNFLTHSTLHTNNLSSNALDSANNEIRRIHNETANQILDNNCEYKSLLRLIETNTILFTLLSFAITSTTGLNPTIIRNILNTFREFSSSEIENNSHDTTIPIVRICDIFDSLLQINDSHLN